MTHRQAVALILFAAAIWGLSFPVVDYALKYFDPFALLAMHFTLAALALGGYLAWRRELKFIHSEWKAGLLAGSVLFLAFAAQVSAQLWVPPTTSAFITGLYVVFVPVLSTIFLSHNPSKRLILSAFIAFIGLFMLSGARITSGVGEGLTLMCALAYAVHIIVLSKFRTKNSIRTTFVQMAVCAILSLAAWSLVGQMPTRIGEVGPWVAVAYLGIFVSAFAYWAQTRAQRELPAIEVANLFLSEPVMAGVFSVLFFGEVLNGLQLAGAGLILLGIYESEHK